MYESKICNWSKGFTNTIVLNHKQMTLTCASTTQVTAIYTKHRFTYHHFNHISALLRHCTRVQYRFYVGIQQNFDEQVIRRGACFQLMSTVGVCISECCVDDSPFSDVGKVLRGSSSRLTCVIMDVLSIQKCFRDLIRLDQLQFTP